MQFLLAAICVLSLGGVSALLTRRFAAISTFLGVAGTVVGCGLGLVPVWQVLASGVALTTPSLVWPTVPDGVFSVEIDALSAVFLLPVFILPPLAAIFGSEYMQRFASVKPVGSTWFFLNILVGAMAVLVIARNGLLFLLAWEVMSLASYFLIVFDDERDDVREAGWAYLISTHLGAAFLLPLFILLGQSAGSLEFRDFVLRGPSDANSANILFILGVIGFGTKAGLMPFHVWLPDTYPRAPGYAPAVLSGVMSKMGIYGIIRLLTFLRDPPFWWGWTFIALGTTSAVIGVMFALAQRDLKRLLAYSSIENIGIISVGLGMGLLGISSNEPALAVFGLAGTVLHVLNHAAFKGLLFLGAAAVEQGTACGQAAGITDVNRLGGLIKRMPGVAICFAVGCASVAGLPPFNGFVSEFLIFLAAFREEVSLHGGSALAALGGITALSLSGGVGAACFALAMGVVFLGAPRTEAAAKAVSPGWWMLVPMQILSLACLGMGLFAFRLVGCFGPLITAVTGFPAARVAQLIGRGGDVNSAGNLLAHIITASVGVLVLTGALAGLRWWLLRGRSVTQSVTWGCGYRKPEASMQYTGSSFAQPLVDTFIAFLRTRKSLVEPLGLFPSRASLQTETPDATRDLVYNPLFRVIADQLSRLRWLQHGRVHYYILYLTMTVILLLAWQLGMSP